jgi:glycosyltransferase involved in cell wall biosynthesis
MATGLRIALATAGRFHILDLARELCALGEDVKFYSYVPKARALKYGLPESAHVGLLSAVWPWFGLQRFLPKFAPQRVDAAIWAGLNRAVIRTLQPCDVFVCMSGIYLEAAIEARRRYGAKIVLVRCSKHILAQDEILARTPGAMRPSALSIERELAGYQLADLIDVPSRHVARSFERDSSLTAKIVVNPLGVDLDIFPLLPPRPRTAEPVLLFAGTWSLQKGCDLLTGAVQADPRLHLLHVGEISDCPFPDHPRCRHLPKVEQSQLTKIYAQADALVLPSRQDGFGMVLVQALSSGLPVLCTDATGGEDLMHTPTLRERIRIIRAEDGAALSAGLSQLADRLGQGPDFPALTEADRQALTWTAFARRYAVNLCQLLKD